MSRGRGPRARYDPVSGGDPRVRQAARAVLAAQQPGRLHGADGRGSIRSSGTGTRPSWRWASRPGTGDRALTELERLAQGQWPDGMIPHIIFHAPSDAYFPGPDVWGTEPRAGRQAGDLRHHAAAGVLRPRSGSSGGPAAGPTHAAAAGSAWPPSIAPPWRWHRWWSRARDPEGTGLVAVLHNWETGSDNSPAWDAALARVPTTTSTPIRRRDTGHVDPGHAPQRRRLPALHPPSRRLPRCRLEPGAAMGGRALQGRRRPDDRHPGSRDGRPRGAPGRARREPGGRPSSATCAGASAAGLVAAVAPGTRPVRLP